MQIINKFHSYAWAAMTNKISDGITPFNIVLMIELATRAMAAKVEWLRAVEPGGMAMTYSDAEIFLKNDSQIPANTTTCAYHLAAHNLLVDIMLIENSLFAVIY